MLEFILALLLILPAPLQQSETNPDPVLKLARANLASWEGQLGAMAWTEDYTQTVNRKGQTVNGAKGKDVKSVRHIVSDIVLIRDGADWFPVRGVSSADGLTNDDKSLSSLERLEAMAAQGGRPDPRSAYRSMNLPNVALAILRDKNASRFVFRKIGEEVIERRTTWKVSFEEKPTLSGQNRADGSLLSGTLFIEPSTGRVFRTLVDLNRLVNEVPFHLRVSVNYQMNSQFALLVPTAMDELYEGSVDTIEGHAAYSNFRRRAGITAPVIGGNADGPSETEYKLVVDVPLVTLDVSVNGDSGAVNDLKASDFQVYENNVLQTVEHFTPTSVPFNIFLLFDWSSSTLQKRTFLQQAATGFVDYLRTQDWIGIGRFTSEVQLPTWTRSREVAKLNISQLTSAFEADINTTNIYTSLESALIEQLVPFSGRRRSLVVLTDGQDTAYLHALTPPANSALIRREQSQFDRLLGMAREQRVPIYFVATNTDVNPEPLPPNIDLVKSYGLKNREQVDTYLKTSRIRLEQLAAASGGRVLYPKRFEDIVPLYKQISQELGSYYSMAYRSNIEGASGHRQITVKTKDGRLHVVQSRSGYDVP